MPHRNVCPGETVSKDKFQRLLASGWTRIAGKVGKGRMADCMGLTQFKTIDRVLTLANLPEAHTIFNSLAADETALDEILSEYGYQLVRIRPEAANDFRTLSGLCETAAEYAEALKDSHRDHVETLRIVDKLRPHMPALAAMIHEADEIRGAA